MDQAHWISWGHVEDAVVSGTHCTIQHLPNGRDIWGYYKEHPQEEAMFRYVV